MYNHVAEKFIAKVIANEERQLDEQPPNESSTTQLHYHPSIQQFLLIGEDDTIMT